jgi:hypothetical protein
MTPRQSEETMVEAMFAGNWLKTSVLFHHYDHMRAAGIDYSNIGVESEFYRIMKRLQCKEFSRFTQADIAAVEHAFAVAGISLGKVGEERLYGEQKVMVLPAQPDFQTFPWVSIPAGIALIVVGIALMILSLT